MGGTITGGNYGHQSSKYQEIIDLLDTKSKPNTFADEYAARIGAIGGILQKGLDCQDQSVRKNQPFICGGKSRKKRILRNRVVSLPEPLFHRSYYDIGNPGRLK